MKKKLVPSACMEASFEAGVVYTEEVAPGVYVLRNAYAVTDYDYFKSDEPDYEEERKTIQPDQEGL